MCCALFVEWEIVQSLKLPMTCHTTAFSARIISGQRMFGNVWFKIMYYVTSPPPPSPQKRKANETTWNTHSVCVPKGLCVYYVPLCPPERIHIDKLHLSCTCDDDDVDGLRKLWRCKIRNAVQNSFGCHTISQPITRGVINGECAHDLRATMSGIVSFAKTNDFQFAGDFLCLSNVHICKQQPAARTKNRHGTVIFNGKRVYAQLSAKKNGTHRNGNTYACKRHIRFFFFFFVSILCAHSGINSED